MASDESFVTPVYSTDDQMTLSPNIRLDGSDHSDTTCEYLTDGAFDRSNCDETVLEVPVHDDNIFFDPNILDYFENKVDSNKNQTFLHRGRDSLFTKFDPLYAKTLLIDCSQEKSLVDLTVKNVGYETSSTNSILMDNIGANSSSAGSVVSKSGTEKPTPTQVRPERLIDISGMTPPMAAPRSPCVEYYKAREVDCIQSLRAKFQNKDQELLQLRHEKKESEYELQRTKEELGNEIKKLTSEVDTLRHKEIQLEQQVTDRELNNKEMAIAMKEYEKTLSLLIDKQDTLKAEREQALNHLSISECSFNDLLTKYEKSKVVIKDFKENQKLLMDKISEYETGLAKYESLYNNLKQVTSDSLNTVNETLDQNIKAHIVEIRKLNAIIKKHEVAIRSLQKTLTQKGKHVEELTQICDHLINNVS